VRKLAASRHGPADWILHARMVARSWDGERVEAIAKQVGCSAQTVRRRLHRFDAEGIEGLGDRSKSGRPRRLTAEDNSQLIALVRQAPPGRLVTQRDGTMVAREEEGEAQWSLNALARAAKEAGIGVKRTPTRRLIVHSAPYICSGSMSWYGRNGRIASTVSASFTSGTSAATIAFRRVGPVPGLASSSTSSPAIDGPPNCPATWTMLKRIPSFACSSMNRRNSSPTAELSPNSPRVSAIRRRTE
jgi:transposase